MILDGVDTGVLPPDIAQHLRRKNADVADIYFTFLDAAGIFPILDMNQNTKTTNRQNWVALENWKSYLLGL